MYKDVKDKLVEILNTITGDNLPIKVLYGLSEPLPEVFPCANVRASGTGTEIRLDSASNEMTVQFTIRVLMQAENTEDIEDQRVELIDSIKDLFRTKENVDTLNGVCHRFDIPATIIIEASEAFPVIGFDLIVQASKIMLIS